jgi:hypothetical protein
MRRSILLFTLLALVLPARASAFDSPLEPVTPDGASRHGLGLVVTPQPQAEEQARAQDALPASVDLSAWAMPVGDQGQVNSCAAWAVDYNAMGYWMNKQGIAGGPLAPMYTYSQVTGGQNIGTTLPSHMTIAKAQGVDVLSDYAQGNYDYATLPTAAQTANAAHWRLTDFQSLAISTTPGSTVTQESIKAALADGEPVVIAMPVYQNFYSVTSANHGLYTAVSGSNMGYHAVTALGYDATGLRIENQWGTSWGDGGWATLGWSFVNAHVVEARAVGPLVDSATAPVPAVPASTVAPVASGPVARGQVVSVDSGTWTDSPSSYTYAWQRDTGSGYTAIPGATAASYTLTSTDVGATVRALVTARNAAGAGVPAVSNALGPVLTDAPANAAAPTVSGTPARGSLLTATPGSWSAAGNSYRYQWQRDSGGGWANILGATTATYTLALADENAQVRVLVTATNVDGSASAASAPVGPIGTAAPINGSIPVVSGTAKRGLTLTTNAGSWSGVGNTYAYQWQRDAGSGFVDIAGATRNTYVLTAADSGLLVRSRITATNPDGTVSVFSAAVGPVAGSLPANTTPPTIAGTVARGNRLTAANGTWTGAGNVYSYVWQRDDGSGFADIAGATAAIYTLTVDDLGARVRVAVTATNPDGTATAFSAPTAGVASSLPTAGATPVASGLTRTGQRVTTTAGAWTPAGATFAYQWQLDTGSGFADIAGATTDAYTLTAAEAFGKVRARVTATNPDGSTVAYSNALGPVLPTPVNTVAPGVAGTLTDASPLSAVPGTWNSAGSLAHTYKYQWIRCPQAAANADSPGCAVLPGATGATYTTVGADVGARIAVRVTATNAENVGAAAVSGLTGVLTGRALTNLVAPAISGTAAVRAPLTASDGTWSVPLTRATYQWRRCDSACVDILGATGRTYTPVAADTAKRLLVVVTASSPGRTATASSALSAPIQPLPLPTVVANITISGVPARQQALRANMPVWNDYPTAFAYQWLRCDADGDNCLEIPHATTAGYVLAKADEGTTIRVRQTGTNSTGSGMTTSDPTALIAAVPPVPGAAPAVTGTTVVGGTLSSTRGGWTTSPDTTYAYGWERCDAAGANCVPIAGANGSTYRLVSADVDATLRSVITATNADASGVLRSAVSAKVKPAPPSVNPVPKLTGAATVGQTLTSTTGAWSGITGTVTTTFWRCAASCTAIVTGTTRTYTLTSADAGFRIRVSVTGVGPGGTTQAYAVAVIGPVRSPTTASMLAAAAPVALKSSTGKVMAKASASVPKAGGQATVTVTAAAGFRRGYRTWACPTGDFAPCSKAVKLGAKAARFKVAVDAGERVRVVVTKTRR